MKDSVMIPGINSHKEYYWANWRNFNMVYGVLPRSAIIFCVSPDNKYLGFAGHMASHTVATIQLCTVTRKQYGQFRNEYYCILKKLFIKTDIMATESGLICKEMFPFYSLWY